MAYINPDSEINYSNKTVSRLLYYFMEDTLKKINKNMVELEIGIHNPKLRKTGGLEKSIHATIVRNAGGREAVVTFFYRNYARFVETATQDGQSYVNLPEMTGVTPVVRPDGKTRMAKPFLHSEIRRKVERTLNRLGKIYTYRGAAAFWYELDDPNDKTLHPRNEKSLAELGKQLGIL